MLKQFKIIILVPTCFGSRRNHHQGAVLCLAKTTEWFFHARRYRRSQCYGGISACCAVHSGDSSCLHCEPHCFNISMIFIIVCISWNNYKWFWYYCYTVQIWNIITNVLSTYFLLSKVKVAFWSFFNTEAIWPIVFWLPTSSRIHLQRRHTSYRCARPLPAKAVTITKFC